ncbi:double-strand break repair helicase AddA [Pelagovum pacificum]|uniref:DNA 3'-5' helicase n=1 Tax=Pelagovum pacificum TaxID=2588711 RepID=A0A5C5GJU9_9RHOB|nr:double-strand break repair helicase AddA [Pelagovum pacificum]QQA42761.1 double-strand break repair helicase AddA [Pelagovum pacificum]TNY34091.1 double-strand break repair helicase AddA [Pelagovum pacificum]
MTPRDDATEAQVRAADPDNSTWLSANAGSGKTRVLTDRVARLLLQKVDPQNILCLTFTKAAASEMQNRLFDRLGGWAMMEAGALRQELERLGAPQPDDPGEARRLFARAIETPGGLKIQTIHAFCASVLRRFPLEAGVSPRFTEMEDRAADLLRRDVLDDLAERRPELVERIARHFTGADIGALLGEVAVKRTLFRQPADEAVLAGLLGAEPGLTVGGLLDREFGADVMPLLRDLQAVLATGSSSEVKAAATLSRISGRNKVDLAVFGVLVSLLLTGKGAASPFTAKIGKFPTKATRAAHSGLSDDLDGLMQDVEDLREPVLAQAALGRSLDLHAFGHAFCAEYEARKLARGLLDFDDLILKTRDLLNDPALAQWVLYRLDGGIDHILVDEAQDTSPGQWSVIERLTEEMLAAGGGKDRRCTLFVVGDKKQSIYSFQGADAEAFDSMRGMFAERLTESGRALVEQPLQFSFRSAEAVLSLVDRTFVGPFREGLDEDVLHRPFKDRLPGRVDLWPPVPKSDDSDPDEPWHRPVDHVGQSHHDVVLANQIARHIRQLIDGGETIPDESGGTPVRRRLHEGDFLILVRRRRMLFREIIRACKSEGLAIAGADQLSVMTELAVKDLTALLRFLALPEDDLSLAAALKSPLFSWTEQDLFTLAHPRGERTLWQALRESDAHPETRAIIDDLRRQSDFLRPYDLISRILVRHGGRRKLLNRLGAEAEDGIDAFVGQALAYERSSVPSLTGFLAWMETDELKVKRQMEGRGHAIRVMTVHGSKGLEAPVVILPDTSTRRSGNPPAIWDVGEQPVWGPLSDNVPASLAPLKRDMADADERERRRLLYVAMTRAEKWLIVCASGDVGDSPEKSWYNMVAAGLEEMPVLPLVTPSGEGLRYQTGDWAGDPLIDLPRQVAEDVAEPLFATVTAPLPAAGTVSPSALGGAKVMPGETDGGTLDEALERGTRMHLLLEHLPGLDRALWSETAAALFDGEDPEGTEDLVRGAAAILDHPELSALFRDALAEVPVTAALAELDGRRMHGTIDLLIPGDTVLAIDFKTNRIAPSRPEDTPDGLLRQMGAYAAALGQIYPGRTIETAILWTSVPELMRLPTSLVMASLRRASAP